MVFEVKTVTILCPDYYYKTTFNNTFSNTFISIEVPEICCDKQVKPSQDKKYFDKYCPEHMSTWEKVIHNFYFCKWCFPEKKYYNRILDGKAV